MSELKPCPFCGSIGLDFDHGSTFRWRTASCSGCGATTGEERIQTTGSGTPEEWEADCRERLIAAWNRRAGERGPMTKLERTRIIMNALHVGDAIDMTEKHHGITDAGKENADV